MKDVKSPAGSLRAERAATTRKRIEGAARALFARRGYGATTLREIALEAGVAVQTVYAVFGSKANILRAMRLALVDDPPADEAYAAALAEPDAGRALGHFARSIRLRWETGHDIVAVHVEAVSVDPGIRGEVERVFAARRRGIDGLARTLVARSPALGDAARVGAMIDALTTAGGYDVLTGVHGWTPDEYEVWLASSLRAIVLGRRAVDRPA